jgi:hypothetical protein
MVRVFIIAFCFLLSDHISCYAQFSSEYMVRMKGTARSDFQDLLDSGRARQYIEHTSEFESAVSIQLINDSIWYLRFTSCRYTSQGMNSDVPELMCFFLRDADKPRSAKLIFSVIPDPIIINCLRELVSNLCIQYPVAFTNQSLEEPFEDNIYMTAYHKVPDSSGSLCITRSKIVPYKPGITMFRTVIDSFTTSIMFDHASGRMTDTKVLELKRQKMGSRILSYIRSEISIHSLHTTTETAENLPDPAAYVYSFPVYRKMSYQQRMLRNSQLVLKGKKMEDIIRAIVDLKNKTGEPDQELVKLLRSAFVTGLINPEKFRKLTDSFPVNSLAFSTIEEAMIEAGSYEAQQIIAEWMKSENLPETFYRHMLINLGVTAPLINRDLIYIMMKARAHSTPMAFSNIAGLALANNAMLLDEDQDQFSRDTIIGFLESCFNRHAASRSDTLQWLKESGNAANNKILPLAKYCLDLNDTEMYQCALYSLRFIPGEEVDSLLAGQFRNNKYSIRTLLEVVQLRYPSSILRLAIYNYLHAGKNEDTGPELVKYLECWKDEIRTLSSELAHQDLHFTEIDK